MCGADTEEEKSNAEVLFRSLIKVDLTSDPLLKVK